MIRVDECAWNAISNACHTVTLQPYATFQTFSLGRKEKLEEKKILLSNRSGPNNLNELNKSLVSHIKLYLSKFVIASEIC